jgi:hypothetical protein
LAQVGGTTIGPGPGRGLVRERDQARKMDCGPGQFPDGNNVFLFTFLISSMYYATYSILYYSTKINIF